MNKLLSSNYIYCAYLFSRNLEPYIEIDGDNNESAEIPEENEVIS